MGKTKPGRAATPRGTVALDPRERRIRLRLRDDFEHYAAKCLKIAAKDGALVPLRLNRAQSAMHAAIERQLKETGKVRALILKGRQQGASTYVEGRFFWKVTHRRGVRAFILSHLEEATQKLFEMAKRFYDHCPAPVRPRSAASNARELVFDLLDSGYRVATAGSRGAGRAHTIQYFHGSEVAYWPHAEAHVAGALQAVPDAAGSEIILESTSAGRGGLFHAMCQAALRGEGDYRLIFAPWFWQAEYRRPAPAGFALTGEEEAYRKAYGLGLEQMAWRRAKVLELRGIWNFRREYPATVEEAFKAETPGALWRRELIEATRVHQAPPLRRIVVGLDPSGGGKQGNDEAGIVVAGIAHDNHLYVLDDLSGRMSPNGWAARAVAGYERHRADRIVAEQNFGGEMVEHVIRTVSPQMPVKLVAASRGKQVRAEPVAALYEQGRVHHVGTFAALEDELVTWDPAKSERSPNRLDALVWAVVELVPLESRTGILDFYAEAVAGRRNEKDEAE